MQHGDGREGIFHSADVLEEFLHGGGLLLVQFAALFQQQLTDFVGSQILDANLVVHALLPVRVGGSVLGMIGRRRCRFRAFPGGDHRQQAICDDHPQSFGLWSPSRAASIRTAGSSCQLRSANLGKIRRS